VEEPLVRVGDGDLDRAAAVPGAGDRERFVDAPLLLGAGDWDLLLCPADGVGRVRRDLVGVPGGEGAASLDDDVVFELVIVYIVNCTIRCERLECACTIVASS